MEEWRVISNLPGYQVSSEGRVKRSAYTITYEDDSGVVQHVDEQLIESKLYDNTKYVNVNSKTYAVHLLVAAAFLAGEQSKESYYVTFLDKDTTNCAVSNLQCISISDFRKQEIENGTRTQLPPYSGIKLQCKESGQIFNSIKELSEYLNLSRTQVTKKLNSREPIDGNTYVRIY